MTSSADEFIGLTREQAQRRADQRGWTIRDMTEPGWYTSELRSDRVDIWLDHHDVVIRAEPS